MFPFHPTHIPLFFSNFVNQLNVMSTCNHETENNPRNMLLSTRIFDALIVCHKRKLSFQGILAYLDGGKKGDRVPRRKKDLFYFEPFFASCFQ